MASGAAAAAAARAAAVRTTTSRLFMPSSRETAADSTPGHQLLIRAGYVRKSSVGVFTLLPLAVRALAKLEALVDEELHAIGAQKLAMPTLLPADLWKQTGRWQSTGQELFRLKDRRGNDMLLGPTHEEEITQLVAAEVTSYRQLPLLLYQTTRKFRDEVRPRFGLIRGREFVMKDLYTFDETASAAMATYASVCGAYDRIFQRLGLPFVKAEADTGNIGGSLSHEYQLISNVGEDELLKCPCGAYASNVECAVGSLPAAVTTPAADPATLARAIAASGGTDVRLELVEWPRPPPPPSDPTATTPSALLQSPTRPPPPPSDPTATTPSALLQSPPPPSDDMTLLVLGPDRRGNPFKLKSLRPAWAAPFGEPTLHPVAPAFLADALAIDDARAPVTLLVDASALATLGALAREPGNVPAPVRACTVHTVGDFRTARAGDICPRSGTPSCLGGGSGPLGTVRGIEVGHAFYLGDKYSSQLKARFKGRSGTVETMEMGCFGLGMTRILAGIAEVAHDADGLVWPAIVAPYRLCIVVAGNPKDATYATLVKAAEQLYDAASTQVPGLSGEVVLDDRDATTTTGYRLKDAALVGYPYTLVVGRAYLESQQVELHTRHTRTKALVAADAVVTWLHSVVV